MQKRLILLIAILVSLALPFETINAATVVNKTSAQRAVMNLQKLISKTTLDLRDLGENSINGDSKLALKYSERLAPLTSKYMSERTSGEVRVSSALADLNRKSNFIVLWENFVGCNAKFDPCKTGVVYNIPFNANYGSDQSGFDRNVLIGVLAPQDKMGYDKAREIYKLALENLTRVNDAYQEADFALREQVFAEYDAEEERLTANINIQKLALSAAKRASVASRDFETNFKTAFQFQHNLDSLYLVGSASFPQIESYLDALNVVSASQAYALGAGISRNYQASKALTFNRKLGNVFVNSREFRSLYSKALSVYRNSAKK